MKRIFVISDLHNCHKLHLRKYMQKCDILIIPGDISNQYDGILNYIDIFKEYSQHQIYVPGNHEYLKCKTIDDYYNFTDKIKDLGVQYDFHVLQSDVLELYNYRFIGCTLWSHLSTPSLLNNQINKLFHNDVVWLSKNMKQDDIVITHYLPIP